MQEDRRGIIYLNNLKSIVDWQFNIPLKQIKSSKKRSSNIMNSIDLFNIRDQHAHPANPHE